MRSFATLLTALSLPLYTLAAHHGEHVRRHADVALRARNDIAERGSARLTWYDVTTGTTACGGNYGPEAFVVALNSAQWDGGSHCGKSFPLSYNGVTVTVTVADECPGCPWGGLDCTKGVFSALAGGLGAGVIYGDWSFDGSNPAPKPSPTPTTPKYTPPPPPTSTPEWTPPPAPQTPYTPSSSSSSSTSTSKTSSSSSASKPAYTPQLSSSSTSSATPSPSVSDLNVPSGGLAQPAGTVADGGETENLKYLFDLMIFYGDVVINS